MDVELSLAKTNKVQFCNWLLSYYDKKRIENHVYFENNEHPHFDHPCHLSFPAFVSPDYNQSEIKVDFSRFAKKPDGTEFFEWANTLPAAKISWLETSSERLKVVVVIHDALWTVYPLLDLLAKLGDDWPETRGAIWAYVQPQADRYGINLPGSFFHNGEDVADAGQDLAPAGILQTPPLNQSDLEKVKKYSMEGGRTISQIAQMAAVSVSTVKRYRKKLGIRSHSVNQT